jgi:tetratricopeptide (TPR) repeat protein
MRKCLIIGLLSLAAFGCSKSPEERIFDLFQTGTRQVDRYEFDAALATFKKIGEINPSTPLGHYGSGLVFERQLQYYDALHVYMSITNSSPSFAPAFAGAWRLFTRLEQWNDAVQMAAEYSRLLPEDPEARLVLARALMNIQQYGRARQEVDKAVELGADRSLAALAKAQAYSFEHQTDSAEVALQTAMSTFSESPVFYALAADYFEAAGLIDSAVSLGRASVESASNDFDLIVAQFYRALRHNYFFEARQVIRRLKEQGAGELVTTGLEMFYYLARENQTHARHACDTYRGIAIYSISTLTYDIVVRGRQLDMFTGSRNIGAINRIMQTNHYDPEFQEYMKYFLAVLFAGYFDDLDGLKQLRTVSSAFLNRKEIRLSTAYCLYRTGQHEEYEQLMSLLSKYHSTQPDWLTGMADIYGDRFVRRYDSAGQYYRTALQKDRWYRPAFENAVDMYRRLKEPKKALKMFDAYPYFEQRYPEIALLKALCLVEQGDIQQGVDLFEQKFPHVRGDLARLEEITSLLDKRNRQEERTKLYRRLSRINADNAEALVLAAEFESDRADFQAALNLAEKAQSLESDYVAASVQKARALYGLGKRSEAFEIFERNLVEARFNVDNNHYFSRILATEQVEPKRAANLARRALFDSGHELKVWMNLSYVYFQIGRYDLSRGEAQKAKNSHKEEPEPFFRIGMAMFMEEKEEAGENLERAIELGLKGEYLEIARQTLQKL